MLSEKRERHGRKSTLEAQEHDNVGLLPQIGSYFRTSSRPKIWVNTMQYVCEYKIHTSVIQKYSICEGKFPCRLLGLRDMISLRTPLKYSITQMPSGNPLLLPFFKIATTIFPLSSCSHSQEAFLFFLNSSNTPILSSPPV